MDQLDKENADLNEKNDLLSPADWIMFLSWEIYGEKNTTGQYNTTPIIALLVAFAFSVMSLMFAALSSDLPDEIVKDILVSLNFSFYIVAIIMLCFVGYIVTTQIPKTTIGDFAMQRLPTTWEIL